MADKLGMQVTVGANIAPLTKGLNDAKKELAATAAVAAKTDSTLAKMSGGANQATNAMTNLGRVVQDAPYGFIGIANNINPLLESFQRLKAETGSTGTALKALGGSLLGAGGLGLAVSVVTSLLAVFAMNSRSSGEATKEHKEKIDETKNAAKAYSDAISAASSSVISHQGKLTDLNRVLRDTSNNFNNLSTSIVNQALAEYLATQKEGLVKKILDARIKQVLELNKIMNPLNKVREFTTMDLFSKNPLKKQIAETEADLVNLNRTVKSLGLSELFAGIFKVEEIKVRPKKIKVEKPLKIEFKIDGDTVLIDEEAGAKALSEAAQKLNNNLKGGTAISAMVDLELDPRIKVDGNQAREGFIRELRSKGISTTDRILENGLKIKIPVEIATADELIAGLNKFKSEAQIAINSTASALSSLATSAISSVLTSMGNIVTGKGGISDMFKDLGRVLGAGIKQFGQQILQFALLAKLAKFAAKNPVTGIAAGIALIALGSLIEAAASKNAFATGVRNFEGGVALVGERGPELVNLPRGAGVVPNNEMSAYGGRGNQVFIPAVSLRGSDLVIAFNRASQSMSRNS